MVLADCGLSKKLTFTGALSAGTGYVRLIDVYKGDGSDTAQSSGCATAPGKVYLKSACQSFPDDIRFFDNDQETELAHGYLPLVGTDETFRRFAVKIEDSLNSGQTAEVYIGWDFDGASASDLDEVFDGWYDFTGGIVDAGNPITDPNDGISGQTQDSCPQVFYEDGYYYRFGDYGPGTGKDITRSPTLYNSAWESSKVAAMHKDMGSFYLMAGGDQVKVGSTYYALVWTQASSVSPLVLSIYSTTDSPWEWDYSSSWSLVTAIGSADADTIWEGASELRGSTFYKDRSGSALSLLQQTFGGSDRYWIIYPCGIPQAQASGTQESGIGLMYADSITGAWTKLPSRVPMGIAPKYQSSEITNGVDDIASFVRFECKRSATVSKIRIHSGATGSAKVAIYNNQVHDLADYPYQKLAEGTGTISATGWGFVTLDSPLAVTSGTKYWLCVVVNNDGVITIGPLNSGRRCYFTSTYETHAWADDYAWDDFTETTYAANIQAWVDDTSGDMNPIWWSSKSSVQKHLGFLPNIVLDGSTYRMLIDQRTNGVPLQHASSSSFTGPYTHQGTILDHGAAGEWDDEVMCDGFWNNFNGKWQIFYTHQEADWTDSRDGWAEADTITGTYYKYGSAQKPAKWRRSNSEGISGSCFAQYNITDAGNVEIDRDNGHLLLTTFRISSRDTFSNPRRIMSYSALPDLSSYLYPCRLADTADATSPDGIAMRHNVATGDAEGFCQHNGSNSYQAGPDFVADTFYLNEVLWETSDARFFRDGASFCSGISTNVPDNSVALRLEVYAYTYSIKSRWLFLSPWTGGDEPYLSEIETIQINVALTDGCALGEGVGALNIVETVLGDGLEMGEDWESASSLSASVDEGVALGDIVQPSTEWIASLLDGLQISEALLPGIQRALSLTDGASMGDAESSLVDLPVAVSDGVLQGDSPASAVSPFPAITDVVLMGDVLAVQVETGGYVEINLALSDGFKAGESLSGPSTLGVSASDGFKIGDVPGAIVNLYVVRTDGVKIGDAPVPVSLVTILTDGMALSDVPSVTITLSKALTDGIILTDFTPFGYIPVFNLAVTDGFKMSEVLQTLIEVQAQAADSMVLTDQGYMGEVKWVTVEDAIAMSDSARIRLPYVKKVPREDPYYHMGEPFSDHDLGEVQEHELGTMRDKYTTGQVKGRQP